MPRKENSNHLNKKLLLRGQTVDVTVAVGDGVATMKLAEMSSQSRVIAATRRCRCDARPSRGGAVTAARQCHGGTQGRAGVKRCNHATG
jgi:hypothetical protein